MKRALRFLALMFVIVLVTVACAEAGPVDPPIEPPTTTTVVDDHGHGDGDVDQDAQVYKVEAKEFQFSPTPITVTGEMFTIELYNEGMVDHDMVVEGAEDQGASHLTPGTSGSVTYMLEPGTYTVYCSVPGHRDAGMEGTLIVTAADHDDDHDGGHELSDDPDEDHEDGHESP